jgi:PPOX class probable F420-dependent enzyme
MVLLDQSVCRSLLQASPVARLATVAGDGSPHVVPCCYLLDEDRLYSVVDGKPKSTSNLRRLDNIRANPRTSLVVDRYADDWTELWWVRVDGVASVIEAEGERCEAIDGLVAKYRQYREQKPAGPLLRVDITKVTGWAYDPVRIPTVG